MTERSLLTRLAALFSGTPTPKADTATSLSGADGVAWIEASELSRRLSAGDKLAIVDVRGSGEFSGPVGHIEGSLNLPLAELLDRLGEVRALGDRPVVLVCHTDKRSSAASSLLRKAGFDDVAVLRGGMDRWNREIVGPRAQ